MSLRKFTAFALAGLMTIGIAATGVAEDDPAADPAIAGKTAEELVVIRIQLMKDDGRSMAQARDPAAEGVKEHIEHVLHNYTILPHAFPEGSIVGETNALPVIWEEWDAFNAIFVEGQEALKGMLAALEAGDADAYKAGWTAVSVTCNSCHEKYRDVL